MPNMKTSELRIGNLVDLGNRFAKINEIYHKACTVLDIEETQDTIEDYERTKPIPLNQEWLRNLGFNIGGYDLLFWEHPNLPNIDFAGINWADEEFPEYQFLNVSINGAIIQIDYVHQLQNLYFALTGEEIILKA
jgi:hypothetical protein